MLAALIDDDDMSKLEKMVKSGAVLGADSAPPLDRWRADELLEPDCDLWGLKQIAKHLGVSEVTAGRWANDPTTGLPVSKPRGRWYARKSALRFWMMRKPED